MNSYVGTLIVVHIYNRICYLILVALPVVELRCEQVPLARVLTLNCSSRSGPVQSATCSFDGGPPSSCELINEAACHVQVQYYLECMSVGSCVNIYLCKTANIYKDLSY